MLTHWWNAHELEIVVGSIALGVIFAIAIVWRIVSEISEKRRQRKELSAEYDKLPRNS